MAETALQIDPHYQDQKAPESDQRVLYLEGLFQATNKALAVIEFALDGTVEQANSNFLGLLGYSLDEIKGRHHRIFCEASFTQSIEYQAFWEKLRQGEFQSGEYKRIGKGGKEVWIQASYNPILDRNGRPFKIVKYATDVTAQKLKNADYQSQIAAIDRAQAVIEFNLDGSIRDANENFLRTMGYARNEILGKHHRMFCNPAYTASPAYTDFWAKLNRGEFDSGEYQRFGKNGKEVWIQAAYSPIFGLDGKVYKVVKYATDVSAQKLKDMQLAALSRAQAMIEFHPDGTIITANDNFLNALGYRLEDIQGRHHTMFCSKETVDSPAYKDFWRKLAAGEFVSGQFQRVTRRGDPIWIQATYNPVPDLTGKVVKVVKYAADITREKMAQLELLRALRETAEQLAAASAELSATANQMQGNAERTTTMANSTSAASEEVSIGVRTVATNTEEMTASIKDIARSSAEASSKSAATLKQAEQTNQTISILGQSSIEIGHVIKTISSIAQQTNLLALNATIEAARAGDAGRGFAVVANEVKELAKQTARATEDITNKITSIQRDSQSSVAAVSGIGETIRDLNRIAMAIAASVEEQAATTSEVARVVSESSKGIVSIADNVKGVSIAAQETSSGASQIYSAAKSLSELANQLDTLVKRIDS